MCTCIYMYGCVSMSLPIYIYIYIYNPSNHIPHPAPAGGPDKLNNGVDCTNNGCGYARTHTSMRIASCYINLIQFVYIYIYMRLHDCVPYTQIISRK